MLLSLHVMTLSPFGQPIYRLLCERCFGLQREGVADKQTHVSLEKILYVSSFDTSRGAAPLKIFYECFWPNPPARPIFPLGGFNIHALTALMFIGELGPPKIDL